MPVWIKSAAEIGLIAATGEALACALDAASGAAVAGAAVADIDRVFADALAIRGAQPAAGVRPTADRRGHTRSACISVNDSDAGSVPGSRRLAPGDAVTIDGAACLAGWHADAAVCVAVREGERHRRLVDAAHAVLRAGLAAVRPGRPWSSVADACGEAAREQGVAIRPELDGHGIGRDLHEPPRCWLARPDPLTCPDFDLRVGMVLTLEPAIAERPNVGDGGKDASGSPPKPWCAHDEVTFAVSENGARVLTRHPAVP